MVINYTVIGYIFVGSVVRSDPCRWSCCCCRCIPFSAVDWRTRQNYDHSAWQLSHD